MMGTGTKHIWEGAVGVTISTRLNRTTGEPFYTFELVRCFKRDGSDEMEYTRSFSEKHMAAIARVIERAIVYMHENPLDAAPDDAADAA